MLSLVAINIVSDSGYIINKEGVPVVLYTEDPESAIKDLLDITTEVGSAMRTFIINNIVRPVYSETDNNYIEDLYTTSKIIYIYYKQETQYNRQGVVPVQDVFTLDVSSSDADTIYLSFYYIRKAIKEANKSMKLQLMRKYDIDKIINSNSLNNFFDKVREKYSPDILDEFKHHIKDNLLLLGLNTNNINLLI